MVNTSDYNCRSSSGTAACCLVMIQQFCSHLHEHLWTERMDGQWDETVWWSVHQSPELNFHSNISEREEETYSQTSSSWRCLRGSNKTSAGQDSQPPELQILPVVCNITKAQIHLEISFHSDKFWVVTLSSTSYTIKKKQLKLLFFAHALG